MVDNYFDPAIIQGQVHRTKKSCRDSVGKRNILLNILFYVAYISVFFSVLIISRETSNITRFAVEVITIDVVGVGRLPADLRSLGETDQFSRDKTKRTPVERLLPQRAIISDLLIPWSMVWSTPVSSLLRHCFVTMYIRRIIQRILRKYLTRLREKTHVQRDFFQIISFINECLKTSMFLRMCRNLWRICISFGSVRVLDFRSPRG